MTRLFDTLGLAERWHPALLAVAAMLALAGLDFAGSIFAKEWAERHHAGLYIAGLATFVMLYIVYAKALEFAELSIVAFGWIVLLQVGLLLVDRFRYGVTFAPGTWVAIGMILLLQGYLLLGATARVGGQ
jgi:hypothetical protein